MSSINRRNPTPSIVTRQHSYGSVNSGTKSTLDATSRLAKMASRAPAPTRTASSVSLPTVSTSPLSQSPTQHMRQSWETQSSRSSESPCNEKRPTWTDCTKQHSGYVSFPDFQEDEESTD